MPIIILLIAVLLGAAPVQAAILVQSANGALVAKPNLTTAATAADTAGKKVIITSAYTLTGNFTWPADRPLEIAPGGSINRNGYVLTINSSFSAGLYTCFTGTGTTKFGPGSVSQIEIHWLGASAGSSDNAAALQAAFTSAVADSTAQHPVHAAAGNYTTSTFYVPEGIIFFGDGAIESTGKSGTTFIQKAGTNTDTLRVIPHESGGSYFWYGTIRDMSFLGEAAGTAGSAISFKDASNNSVFVQDTTVIRDITVRRYPSHGIVFPIGALPLDLTNIKCLWNGGHGVHVTGSTNGTQALHFNNLSGDGNLGGDGSGGALLYLKNFDSRGSVLVSNMKSEQRVNSDRGGADGQAHAIYIENCASTQILVNGLTHISSIPDGGNFKKPGHAIQVKTAVPVLRWSAATVRVRAGDTGSDPAIVNDQVNTKAVAYTVGAGTYATAPVTGTFSVASGSVYDTFGTVTAYTARSIENPARQVAGAAPAYSWYQSDGAANAKMWLSVVSSGNWSLRTVNDDGSAGQTALSVIRSGATVTGYNVQTGGLPTFADDAAAGAGGLASGRLYKTAAGVVMVKL